MLTATNPKPSEQRIRQIAYARDVFRMTYWNNRVGFVNDCFWWKRGSRGPALYQLAALRALDTGQHSAVRSLHGVGKTAIAAWAVLHFALTRDGAGDWKVVTTAGAWRQLTKYLWPEIHKWSRRIVWAKTGREPFGRQELLQQELKMSTGHAFPVASDDHSLIEGAHADHLLYVLDEAKRIPDATFDAVEGAMMSGQGTEAHALAISTPGPPSGRFWQIHRKMAGTEGWATQHITLGEAIAAGRAKEDRAAALKRLWGERSSVYRTRVLGEFAEDSGDGVIPLSWLEDAHERWRTWHDTQPVVTTIDALGVDVARYGEDPSALALLAGNVLVEVRARQGLDTMQIVALTQGVLDARGGVAVVDVIGLGAGVVDRLRQVGAKVRAFNASSKAVNSQGLPLKDRSGEFGFLNLRSAGWWHLREQLDPAYHPTLAIVPDDALTAQLLAPTWRDSYGKIQVESKDEIRKRLGRSTDEADAVMQAVALPIVPAHETGSTWDAW